MSKTILITGGAGFIGSCYVLQARQRGERVINLDKLTYAGNPENLAELAQDKDYIFVQGDIGNAELVRWLLQTYRPDAVLNFAAESHADRSIVDPEAFVRTTSWEQRPATGRLAMVERAGDGKKTDFPVPARLDRRSLRHSQKGRFRLFGNDAVQPQQPLFSLRGCQ